MVFIVAHHLTSIRANIVYYAMCENQIALHEIFSSMNRLNLSPIKVNEDNLEGLRVWCNENFKITDFTLAPWHLGEKMEVEHPSGMEKTP